MTAISSKRRAKIRFKDAKAGILEQKADRSSIFVYDAGWREPIACALPLVPNIHTWRDGLHPVFQHLNRRGVAARAASTRGGPRCR